MPLPDPSFDPRRYRDILDEALKRVPVHNPEWTNLSDADPGVTLLQLFAFMTESLLYRAELIPERNRQKYLRLLGLGLQPAQPARGLVSFSLPGAGTAPQTLPPGRELRAGRVPFSTLGGLSVLPIEAKTYYKAPLPPARRAEAEAVYRGLYASYEQEGAVLDYYETRLFAAPDSGLVLPTLDLTPALPGEGPVGEDGRLRTTDGSLWLALLARRKAELEDARQVAAKGLLTVGVLAARGTAGRTLGEPDRGPDGTAAADLLFEVPDLPETPVSTAADQTPEARYRALKVTSRSGNLLLEPGTVELDLRPPRGKRLGVWDDLDPLEAGVGEMPPSLEQLPERERLITWVRVRVADTATDGFGQVDARIHWVGVNAARVLQRARVVGERLADGTGEPDQLVQLSNTPVIPESLSLTVNGEPWAPIDDLFAAPPEVRVGELTSMPGGGEAATDASRVYRLDPESGEVRFGDGARGRRPPAGSLIQASYEYGGGVAGLVGIGAIKKGPAGVKVTNPVPTWGGDAGDTVADGEKALPAFIHHRDRLVSAGDYLEIARRTPGVEIGRIEVLPLFHPDLPDQPAEGVVTLMVIPTKDPRQPQAPSPDTLFLHSLCRYLEPRRILTTELHLRGPVYVGVAVTVGIDTRPGWDQANVRDAVREELFRFLSPLKGGFEGTGWALKKAVEALELWAAATRVQGVAKVNGLTLLDAGGAQIDRLGLEGLELPNLIGVAVASGQAPAASAVLGGAGEAPGAGQVRLPVPVVPEEC